MDRRPGCGQCSCSDQTQQVAIGIGAAARKDRG
jgi:hypothetical protein